MNFLAGRSDTRSNIDQPPKDSQWQPCEIIWSRKVGKFIPVRRASNLWEATVELIVQSIQNTLPNKEHVVVRLAQIFQLLHEGDKTCKRRHHRHQ